MSLQKNIIKGRNMINSLIQVTEHLKHRDAVDIIVAALEKNKVEGYGLVVQQFGPWYSGATPSGNWWANIWHNEEVNPFSSMLHFKDANGKRIFRGERTICQGKRGSKCNYSSSYISNFGVGIKSNLQNMTDDNKFWTREKSASKIIPVPTNEKTNFGGNNGFWNAGNSTNGDSTNENHPRNSYSSDENSQPSNKPSFGCEFHENSGSSSNIELDKGQSVVIKIVIS